MRKRTQAREYALQIMYQEAMNEQGLEETVRLFWEENPDIAEDIRTFARELVIGTRNKQEEIDKVLCAAADNWELKRMAVLDRSILRFATYELLYMQDIPPKVTINEAVNIAKKFSQEDSGKFVNGVLDKINHTVLRRYNEQ